MKGRTYLAMRTIDTGEYVGALRELVEEGHEVNMIISGNSMSPFLIHQRDSICFKKPSEALKKGDIVFYQRDSGQYVCHRICKIKDDGYYIVGDAQNVIEGPVRRDQIFAIITKVKRKGKWIESGNFWWEFFARVWIHIIPFRSMIVKIYAKIIR